MALQFPTFQPPNLVGGFASGFETGMDLRQRYEAIKQARQQQQAQQEMAKAILSAGQPQIALEDQQVQPTNMLMRALQGLGLSITPLDTGQPVAQQPMPSAASIPSQQAATPIMPTTPVQAPKTIAPKQPITPEPTADTSALTDDRTASLGMVKRGSLPAMGDYLEARPSRTGSKPRILVVADKSGNAVLLPTRVNGKNLSDKQARAYYSKTGQNLGTFNNPQAAFDYAYGLANKTLEPVAEPDTVSAPTEAPAPAVTPTDTTAEIAAPTQPIPSMPIIAQSQASAKSLLEQGRQYGLSDAVIRKYPVQALQYIQSKQAQDATEAKAKFDMVNDAIRNIESGKTVRDRAAIAGQYAQMGAISPQLAQALTQKPTADASGVQVVPIDRFSEMIRWTDPDTGETKSQIRSTADKENVFQWISQLYGNDPVIAGNARRKLDEYERMQRQKIQFGVNVRTSAQESKEAKEIAKATAGMGEGINDPDVMNFVLYNKYPPGMGKQAVEVRSAIKGAAMKWMKDNNISPARLAQIRYQYKITEAGGRSLENQRQKIEAFTNNARSNLNMIERMVKTQPNTAVPAINRWIRAGYKSIAGDPEVAKFDALVQATSNEIAKITSSATGAGVTSDSARKEIERSFHPGMSPAQIVGVVNLYRQELNNRAAGYRQIMDENQQLISGLLGESPAAPTRPAVPTPKRQPARPTTQPASGRRVLSASEVKRVKFL